VECYRALPGDFEKAGTLIKQGAPGGNQNSKIDSNAEAGALWLHLAESGFISGAYTGELAGEGATGCTDAACPTNPFGGHYKITTDETTGHQLSIGDQIPVAILYELDMKIDDGLPESGRLRVSADAGDECISGDDVKEWLVVGDAIDCAAYWEL